LFFSPLASATEAFSQTVTIFGNSVPANAVDPDTNAVTLGVKFWSTQAGTISGIRFYRGANNGSGYTVKLFTAGGSLVASAKAEKDTCAVPCWEQVNFASPISLAVNITYIAAYYTSEREICRRQKRSDKRQDERPTDRTSESGGRRQWRLHLFHGFSESDLVRQQLICGRIIYTRGPDALSYAELQPVQSEHIGDNSGRYDRDDCNRCLE
jgi:hypothetical protein